MIGNDSFAVVLEEVADVENEENALAEGTQVYVAGEAFVGIDENDPYILRRVLICAAIVDGHVEPDRNPYIVNGLKLEVIEDDKELRETFIEDFAPKEDDVEH
jgi:hypothetical protein